MTTSAIFPSIISLTSTSYMGEMSRQTPCGAGQRLCSDNDDDRNCQALHRDELQCLNLDNDYPGQ